jgi:anti-sigma factor RsiW
MIDESELSRLVREALPPRAAPVALHEWARAESRRRPARVVRWAARPSRAAAGFLLALAIGAAGGAAGHAVLARSSTADVQRAIGAQLVDAHVSSLMADHLMDVRSSDNHTVKPWFAGRVDFAPRVVALDSVGFPLLGARVTYVQGHDAAVLVYGRRKHVINLFMWHEDASADRTGRPTLLTQRGYSLAHWTIDGTTYWAVSDAAPAELEAFRAAYIGSAGVPLE